MEEKCKGNLNKYCYCCGHYIESEGRLNDEFKGLYTAYFEIPFIADQWYVSNAVCRPCYSTLSDWKLSNGRNQMKFGIPMEWSEPKAGKHDPSDCYVCANVINRTTVANKTELQNFVYKSVESAKIPVTHSVGKVPYKYPSTPESSDASSNDEDEDDEEEEDKKDPSYDPGTEDNTPKLLNQTGKLKRKWILLYLVLLFEFYCFFYDIFPSNSKIDMDFLAIRLSLTQDQVRFLYKRFEKKGFFLPGVVVPNVKELKKITKRTKVDVVLEPEKKKGRKQKAQK